VAFARRSKRRGGTPTGERAALFSARRIRRCGSFDTRLSAFCLLFFLLSSLPDLIRQSMRPRSAIGIADTFSVPRVCMDHRVKPGGDEVSLAKLGRERVARTRLPFLSRNAGEGGATTQREESRGRRSR
jgi:hypothetical protein